MYIHAQEEELLLAIVKKKKENVDWHHLT